MGAGWECCSLTAARARNLRSNLSPRAQILTIH
jgi:hypothetical protein